MSYTVPYTCIIYNRIACLDCCRCSFLLHVFCFLFYEVNSEDGKLSDRTSWKTSDSDDGKEKTKINLRRKSIGKDIPYSLKIWLLPIYTIKPCDYGEVMQNWL